MSTSTPLLGTVEEQRSASLAQITHQRDEAVLGSAALESLAALIENAECPVNSHRPTWLHVARRIHQDASQLSDRVRQYTDRITEIERAIRAQSTFGPSPHPVQPPQGTPDTHTPEWVMEASKLELEQALIEALNFPDDEKDGIWIRMLTKRMDALDGFFTEGESK